MSGSCLLSEPGFSGLKHEQDLFENLENPLILGILILIFPSVILPADLRTTGSDVFNIRTNSSVLK